MTGPSQRGPRADPTRRAERRKQSGRAVDSPGREGSGIPAGALGKEVPRQTSLPGSCPLSHPTQTTGTFPAGPGSLRSSPLPTASSLTGENPKSLPRAHVTGCSNCAHGRVPARPVTLWGQAVADLPVHSQGKRRGLSQGRRHRHCPTPANSTGLAPSGAPAGFLGEGADRNDEKQLLRPKFLEAQGCLALACGVQA